MLAEALEGNPGHEVEMPESGRERAMRPTIGTAESLGAGSPDSDRREYMAAGCCNARPMCIAFIGARTAARVSSRKMDRVQALLTRNRTLS